jgi:looped-hinge helix DNA binding domain, AbrB family
MANVIFEDIVKIMERGQVTIPLKLRELFNFQKGFRLWIRVNQNKKIELEPITEDKGKELNQWLKKMLNDKTQYFVDFDEKKLRQIRKKSKNKLLKLYEKNPR